MVKRGLNTGGSFWGCSEYPTLLREGGRRKAAYPGSSPTLANDTFWPSDYTVLTTTMGQWGHTENLVKFCAFCPGVKASKLPIRKPVVFGMACRSAWLVFPHLGSDTYRPSGSVVLHFGNWLQLKKGPNFPVRGTMVPLWQLGQTCTLTGKLGNTVEPIKEFLKDFLPYRWFGQHQVMHPIFNRPYLNLPSQPRG